MAAEKGKERLGATSRAGTSRPVGAGANGLLPCAVCGRTFSPDRVKTHEEICKRVFNKHRKPYDSLHHRWAGTDNEGAIKILRKMPRPPNLATVKWAAGTNADTAQSAGPSRVTRGGKTQCPSCSKWFSTATAERHIQACNGTSARSIK